MKIIQLLSTVTVGLVISFVTGARAATCTWDGGGEDSNLKTAANWVGDVAPSAGDVLVFQGETRTTPVNDFPEGTEFAMIRFANDGTAGKTKGFTLSGNYMRITTMTDGETAGCAVAAASTSAAITDEIALDLLLPAFVNVGTKSANYHNLTFSGAVAGAGGNRFGLAQQFGAQVKVTGKLSGFTGVRRQNSAQTLWITNPENAFSSPTLFYCGEGTLKLDCAGAMGTADDKTIELGQAEYTAATLSLNATSDQYLKTKLKLTTPNGTDVIRNETSGTTWTIEGDVTTQSQKSGVPVQYVTIAFKGPGNGVIKGNLLSPETELSKEDAGTWSWEGSSVGLRPISVKAGALFLDGDWSSHTNVSLTTASAAIGGTGTVSTVTFAHNSQAKLSPHALDSDGLRVTGAVVLSGTVYVTADAATVTAMSPGIEYKVMTWGSRKGAGFFALDSSLSGVTLVEHANSVALVKTSGTARVWKGDTANNVWDTATANWQGSAVFSDGDPVTFDDTADEGTEAVTVGSAVAPSSVTVSGTRDYSFSGAKITGVTGIAKSGTSVLTLGNDNDFTGTLGITGGAVVQNGTLDGTTVFVNGGAFTNASTALLTGSASILARSGTVVLNNPDNDFTGGVRTLNDGLSMNLTASKFSSFGKGVVNLWSGVTVNISNSGASWPDASIIYGGGKIYLNGNGYYNWNGDVTIPADYSYGPFYVEAKGSNLQLIMGKEDGTSVFRSYSKNGISTLGSSVIYNWYSHILIGENSMQQTNGHKTRLYHADNEIGLLANLQGTVECHARNAIGHCTVKLSQYLTSNPTTAFAATLDLNGYDQTIKTIENVSVVAGSTPTQLIKSDTACVLTVSNDVDSVTARSDGDIQGGITLVKAGAGDWTTFEKNSSTGDVVVAQGTLTLAATDVLPRGSNLSRLVIDEGARVCVTNGANGAAIAAEVPRLTLGGKLMGRGIYGGEGCTVAGALVTPEYFAPGKGAVVVTIGDQVGFMFSLR